MRYRTLYELGRGGMGVVELAEAVGAGKGSAQLVAIKRVLPDLARDARARSMFLREARLLARIDHPSVVSVVEVDPGDEEAAPRLVMEYVEGASLREALERSPGGVPVAVAASIARDVALGLHAAHELRDEAGKPLGVVHRDVSPHNVLVTFDGGAKLLDFGVAKTTEGTRTITGEVKGKVAYMAPEQAMADPVDRRCDVYALGAVLYELLTGKRMLGEGTDLEILKRMASGPPPPVAALRPEVPEALSALVARMTAESPDQRPPTARAAADELEPFASGGDRQAVAAWLSATLPGVAERRAERLSLARDSREITLLAPPSQAPARSPARSPAPLAAALAASLLALAVLLAAARYPAAARVFPEASSPSPFPVVPSASSVSSVSSASSASAASPASAPSANGSPASPASPDGSSAPAGSPAAAGGSPALASSGQAPLASAQPPASAPAGSGPPAPRPGPSPSGGQATSAGALGSRGPKGAAQPPASSPSPAPSAVRIDERPF